MVSITVDRLQRAPMQPQYGGGAGPKLLQSPQQDAAARDGARDVQAGQPGQAVQPAAEKGGAAVVPSVDGDDSETGDLAFLPVLHFISASKDHPSQKAALHTVTSALVTHQSSQERQCRCRNQLRLSLAVSYWCRGGAADLCGPAGIHWLAHHVRGRGHPPGPGRLRAGAPASCAQLWGASALQVSMPSFSFLPNATREPVVNTHREVCR
jgi:hypothetical protein